MPSRCGDGGDEFWEGSAKGDNGQSDDAVGNADATCDGGGGIYDEFATADDTGETEHDKEERFAELPFGLFDFVFFFFILSGHLDDVVEEDGEEKHADEAVAPSDPVFAHAGDGGV